ncbi:MAG: acyl-CoA/acyl-ACP dehydrogenase [Fimbriimonadaceae bacterium]|nr:acyl-CoA/acyl-ACP dehydrogenase [Fimbriimonadaceae bacterium]
MTEVHPVVREAQAYLHDVVRPRASDIDLDPAALGEALDGMCERGLMALKRPLAYGGPNVDEASFRWFQEAVARVSGSLAFLQTQHQSAVSLVSKSDNEVLKQEYLPKMANGERLVGIGFSQLRRAGDPIMRATPVEGGYFLNGHVPWVTGLGFYPEFLIGAALESGEAVFGVVPLAEQDGIRISEPMKLAAMESAQTVTCDFTNWFMASEKVAFTRPPRWIHTNDQINITLQGFFALGCARGGLDVVLEAYEKKQADFILTAWQALDAELTDCRTAMAEAQRLSGDETTEEKLKLRAWAIELAVRCAHAAITASSGAANSIRHPAQRLYREALVYTVSAQTGPIMEATLNRLCRVPSPTPVGEG